MGNISLNLFFTPCIYPSIFFNHLHLLLLIKLHICLQPYDYINRAFVTSICVYIPYPFIDNTHIYKYMHALTQEILFLSFILSYLSYDKRTKGNVCFLYRRSWKIYQGRSRAIMEKTFESHVQNWKCYLCLGLSSMNPNWNIAIFIKILLNYQT